MSITNAVPGIYTLNISDANGKFISAICDVGSPDDFLITDIAVDEPTCDASSDASISLTLSGGSGNYAATWSNGMSGLTIQGLALGTYSVTLTDLGTACEIIENIDVQSTKGITVGTSYDCVDSLINLSVVAWDGGTPPYLFEWSTGLVDSASLYSSLQGVSDNMTYHVTVTSQEGCEEIVVFDSIDCGGIQGDFIVAHSEQCEMYTDQPNLTDLTVVVWLGGIPPYTFQWSTGDVTVSTDPNVPASTLQDLYDGTYYVTITDSQGVMDVYGPMAVDCDEDGTQLFTTYTVDCLSDSTATVSLNAHGGTAPYTFEWEDGTTQTHPSMSLVTLSGNGMYSLTITDADGNVLIEDIEVDCNPSSLPYLIAHSYECTIFSDTTFATVSVAVWDGGILPYTFEWSTGETQIISDPNFPVGTITGDGNGTYYVTITDANGYSEPYGPIMPDCSGLAPVELIAGSADVQQGESFCVDITVANFNDIVGFQFSMDWNPDTLIFDTLLFGNGLSAFDQNSFNLSNTAGGALIVQWFNPTVEQVSLPDNTVLFSLCFEASASSGSSAIAFTSSPTLIEVTDGDMILPVQTTNGQVNVGGNTSPSFLIADAYECTIFPDTTIADVSVIVWAGGTLPYTFEWSTGETQIISDPNLPVGTVTGDGNGTYYVTITDATGYAEVYGPITPNCGGPAAVELIAGGADVELNENFCVDITVANFNEVVGMQFSMDWNPDTLIFDTLLLNSSLPAFDQNSFNLSNTAGGSLIVQWFNPTIEEVSLPDNTVLFSLCFEAAATGSSEIAFTSTPTIVEVTDGNVILPVQLTNGQINILGPEVWPGDTDNDEGVDHYDLLNIGLAYGAAGPARDNPSIIWQGYYADDWGLTTPESLVDYKHIDTNGDGFIDAADTLALVLNWGEEYNFNEPEEEETRDANGIIYVQPDTILLGEEAVLNIILEQGGTPVEDVYGIAFTIVYDTAAVEAESVYASFEESWIGEVNQDLLSFYVDRYDEGRIDIAMTRIDGMNTSGEGVIGHLHITIQDVIFLRGESL